MSLVESFFIFGCLVIQGVLSFLFFFFFAFFLVVVIVVVIVVGIL